MNENKWIRTENQMAKSVERASERAEESRINPHWRRVSKMVRKAFQLKWSNFHRQSQWERQDREEEKKNRSQQQKLTAFVGRNHFIIQCIFCVNAYSSHSCFVSVSFHSLCPRISALFSSLNIHSLVHSFIMNGMTDGEKDLIHLNRILLPLATLFL